MSLLTNLSIYPIKASSLLEIPLKFAPFDLSPHTGAEEGEIFPSLLGGVIAWGVGAWAAAVADFLVEAIMIGDIATAKCRPDSLRLDRGGHRQSRTS